jgi:hypothetical protein
MRTAMAADDGGLAALAVTIPRSVLIRADRILE